MALYSLPKTVDELTSAWAAMPGIGPRTARKLAIYTATSGKEYGKLLAEKIDAVLDTVQVCTLCGNLAESDLCGICSDENRDTTKLLIVESPSDLLQIELASVYNGYYVVLGGLISPLNGVGPEKLRLNNVSMMLDKYATGEVILALSATVEGDATAIYIQNSIKREYTKTKVTRLAKGLPTGAGVEYLDEATLEGALEGRTAL